MVVVVRKGIFFLTAVVRAVPGICSLLFSSFPTIKSGLLFCSDGSFSTSSPVPTFPSLPVSAGACLPLLPIPPSPPCGGEEEEEVNSEVVVGTTLFLATPSRVRGEDIQDEKDDTKDEEVEVVVVGPVAPAPRVAEVLEVELFFTFCLDRRLLAPLAVVEDEVEEASWNASFEGLKNIYIE